MNKSIYDQEESLLENLRMTYPEHIRDTMVDDGLCWAAISNAKPDKDNNNWPECLWTESSRRVLFLLKEPNGNDGDDYKDWNWADGTKPFGNILAYWLDGLMKTNESYCPTYSEISSRQEIFKKYPLALVNCKKIPGGASSSWNTIWQYANRDKIYVRAQIRDILRPNIIVCCGSNDTGNQYRKMISIAREYIFSDVNLGFEKINNWCYYNADIDVLLIDSFHPSLIMNEQDKIEDLIKGFHDFILKTQYKN